VSEGAALARSSVERLAELWRAAWADPSPETFGRCCTPDVRYEDPIATEPLQGLGPLTTQALLYRQALPDMRLEASARCVSETGFACIPWRAVGNHRGEVGDVPASGRFLILHGLHYVELSGGAVRRARGFFDLYDAAVQLGLLPRRGSLAETALLMVRGFGLRPRG
jgi:predicted ester cyclase